MSEKIFVPPIKIQGIKTKLVPVIKKFLPHGKFDLWLEPFMGSGVVGFNVRPHRAVFADINPHIVNFYNAIKSGDITSDIVRVFLQDNGERLAHEGEDFYYFIRDRFNEFHSPLDFLFLNRSCFNGMIRFNKELKFNVPYCHKPERFSRAYITKIVNQVWYIEECLKIYDWIFLCASFEEIISAISESEAKSSFVYCDPPYIDRHVDYYDTWDESSEKRLCALLKESKSNFMLSTWDHNEFRANEYIAKIWDFCRKINFEHFYHVGAKEINRHSMTEALLINYEQGN